MRGSVDEPEMVAGVAQGGLVYHDKKVVAEICILAQILLSKIRFVLFSYTRISYPFVRKLWAGPYERLGSIYSKP